MGIRDIIKKSVIKGFDAGDLLTTDIVVTLGIAALLGLFVYIVYRLTTKSGFYNRGFNKSLALLPVITAGILLAMQSSLVISLGMVGALSIVRFRNAVKDSMDLVFLFWSISVGIIVGAGLYELALIASLGVAVFLFVLDLVPVLRAPCLLVVCADNGLEDQALQSCVKEHCRRCKVRSRNTSARGTELILEVLTKDAAALVSSVAALDHVNSANLLSHDGDVRF